MPAAPSTTARSMVTDAAAVVASATNIDEPEQEPYRQQPLAGRAQAPSLQAFGGATNEEEDGSAPDQAREVDQEGEEERRLPVARVGPDRLRLRDVGPYRVADHSGDLGRELSPRSPAAEESRSLVASETAVTISVEMF